MECPRGSMCTESDHEVKTLKKAEEWYSGVNESHLPIRINQYKAANGRLVIAVYDKEGFLLHKRG